MEPWRRENDKNIANIGNYHLEFNYGMQRLARMTSDGGGVMDITGYGTKQETADRMFAFIAGIEQSKN
jgi:hypothetical protein